MKRLYEYNDYGKVILRLTLFSIFVLLALTINSDYAYAHKYPHIKTAALTYSLTDEIGADFVGRHYDMAINPSGQNYTIIKNIDPQVKCLLYLTISSIRGNDYSELQQFCNQMGYNYDSMFHWANDNVCIDAIAPSGSPCTGNTTCTDPGSRTEFCGWNTFRSIPDFSKPEMWDWIIYKYLSKMGDRYDGVMEDEAVFYHHPNWNYYSTMMCFPFQPAKWSTGGASDMNGWEGFTHDQIRDSLLYLKQNVWLPMMMDSLRAHGKQRYPNPAAYGVMGSDIIDDVILTGTGVLVGEGMHLSPILGSSYFNNAQAWNIMDTIATSEGSAILWCEINQSESLSLGSWARCQMERVCWYYMKADTQHFYFLLTGNSPEIGANDYRAGDSLYKWCPAFEYNIGQPLGSMYDAASGVDPAGQAYTLNARNFENAIVLYRKASGSNYNNSTAVTYDLGGQYQQLYSDGTLGGVTSDASVRNCEGKIYIPYSGSN
ncbi:MAG: hypothetical protein GF307_06280, partial [candidate division Zixibacteria bacterium]|nr:hypothetical protein [candidate division Zixibacteria bacterium]